MRIASIQQIILPKLHEKLVLRRYFNQAYQIMYVFIRSDIRAIFKLSIDTRISFPKEEIFILCIT